MNKAKYRPAFLDHFDQKDQAAAAAAMSESEAREGVAAAIAAAAAVGPSHLGGSRGDPAHPREAAPAPGHPSPAHQQQPPQLPAYQRSFIDGDFEFVSIRSQAYRLWMLNMIVNSQLGQILLDVGADGRTAMPRLYTQ